MRLDRGRSGVQISFSHPSNRVRFSFVGLAQDQGQPSDVACQQNFLRVFFVHFERHRLGNRRPVGTLASDLIDRQNLDGLQDDVGIAFFGLCFRFGADQDDIHPVARLDEARNAAHVVHPDRNRALTGLRTVDSVAS